MAAIYKVLGQSSPSATTNTDLYTVPAATSAVISTLNVCNRSSITRSFRIAVRPAGEGIANKHYLAYDTLVGGNDSISLTLGITLANTDIVTIYASSADLSFNLFGSELT